MARAFGFIFLSIAFLAIVRSSGAAEIVTECPQLNDEGRQLVARKLLPETLFLRRIRQESRELVPPTLGTELEWYFWYKGLAPITDAAFSCIYEDKSELYVPIAGMLLQCRLLIPPHRPPEQWPILCKSETDPGLLLK